MSSPTIPGPLPLWYLATTLVAPVALISSMHLLPTAADTAVWAVGALLLAGAYYVERAVHRSLGVDRRLQFVPSVLGYTAGYVVGALLVVSFVLGFVEGSGMGLRWVVIGAMVGVLTLGGVILEHHRIRLASAKVAT